MSEPATDWKEIIEEGEAERFERYAEEIRAMQRERAAGGAANRALHAKGQAGLEAELVVLPDLPSYAKVGPFAEAKTYRALVRYSNGAGARQSDSKPDVRGLAIKVLGVPGKKIIPGLENATTQDFLLIGSPSTPFRNADEFVAFLRAAQSPLLLLPRVLGAFGVSRGLGVVRTLLKNGAPPASLATARYFSAVPIRFGAHAAHYAVMPRASTNGGEAQKRTPDFLGEELAARLERGPVEYDFRVQFFRDAIKTPIEDASVEWKEEDAPFLTIARLVLPKQDVRGARGRRVAEIVEKLSFDPWHASEELRPLGNMMRARNAAYRLSTEERRAGPEPEPSLLDDLPR
jgi:hypothetical protein